LKESQRALVAVYGPKKYLDFLGSIPVRLWIEKNIGGMEVRGGDISSNRKNLEVMIVFSSIRKSDRLKHLYHLGKMQKNKDVYIEKITKILDSLKLLNSKLGDIKGDFDSIYEEVKSI
jgi:hypothetical protein